MPQLRDSSTSANSREPVSSAAMNGFCRIFGVETEYGVSVTGADRPVDAGQVAMTMFQPVVSRSRSTNTYLTNGSRLYLDVGSHPEYATAEARDPMNALVQDLAGERVMRRLAMQAQERLRESHGANASIHVFKNNVDSAGHAFGCHENYLVRRFVPLENVERELLPFLITRQLFTGAGRVTDEGLQITQRADFLDEAVSSATTRARPMVNTRDEPHADPDSFRRLHVIIGDSNRSQWATWMKLATTHLVLCVMEHAARAGEPSGFEPMALVDPAAANRAVSRYLMRDDIVLETADGVMSPLAMQRRYLELVEVFAADHADELNDVPHVLEQWCEALDALESGDFDALADRVDWAAKRRLFAALEARHPGMARTQLEHLELDYHDVANGRVYESLLARGQMRVLADDGTAFRAMGEPPSDTRAALRGAFVGAALNAGAQFSCDWTRLTVSAPERHEVALLDPFRAEPTEEYLRMMRSLG
ncbi:Pup--protein ligase [Bifidobacterium lemurum]|uniref:Pup--protein ligase n=1 Tax=Bifidobacterium lemurum TaxID=1603886 RepID=A0A261FSX7_9BIFI|nr:Pup--protein ligase [Bifidobacterium lemurum]OZG62282.1 Pup--protein ligase [Bifidobacterium lemurum]QOL33649.1 Pup--protein ligase [Bifidobacterium lemurum]